jgi:arylsulfatase A-like enzyme
MKPNILLVILDGVRENNTTLAGHSRQTTPFLNDFSDESTVYTRAYAPSNWSLPSHASIFTGYHVPEHRITVQYDSLKPGHSIWELLRDEYGYATALFSQNEFIASDQYGLDRGFDQVSGPVSAYQYPHENISILQSLQQEPNSAIEGIISEIREGSVIRSLTADLSEVYRNITVNIDRKRWGKPEFSIDPSYRSPARFHAERFLEWEREQNQPWAACLNFMDANMMHFPWPEPDRWNGPHQELILREIDNLRWDFHSGRQPWWKLHALEPRYDVGIRTVDDALESVLRGLNRQNSIDDTFVVVTSDHGDGVGARSRVRPDFHVAAHSVGIHEQLLHVPLVVRLPGQRDGTVVKSPVSLTDFPDAVKNVCADTKNNEVFKTDTPVVAAAYHDRLLEYLIKNDEWNINEYLDELNEMEFMDPAQAVYRTGKDGIRKYVSWGTDTATVSVGDAQRSKRIDSNGGEVVEATFKSFSDVRVRDTYDSVESVDNGVLDRLQQLGYRD